MLYVLRAFFVKQVSELEKSRRTHVNISTYFPQLNCQFSSFGYIFNSFLYILVSLRSTIKKGLKKSSFVLYSIYLCVSALYVVQPAARAMASPAAVSHSQVGPNRGYICAWPLATKQNFNELPMLTVCADGWLF